MNLTQALIATGLFGSIIAVYVNMQVSIAKINTTIIFFQKDLDRKERALLNLEDNNRDAHKEILLKIDALISETNELKR